MNQAYRFAIALGQVNFIVVEMERDRFRACDVIIAARNRLDDDTERAGCSISAEIFRHHVGTIAL